MSAPSSPPWLAFSSLFGWLATGLLLLGCPGSARRDGGTPDAPDGGLVEIGAGNTRFASLADGQQVTIVHGPQGGMHIWTAIRASKQLEAKAVVLRLKVLSGSAPFEELTNNPFRIDLEDTGTALEYYGLQASLPGYNSSDFAGKELRLRVELEDTGGQKAADERRVIAVQ